LERLNDPELHLLAKLSLKSS